MADSDSKTSGTKSAPIIIQSEGSSFNAGIVLDETNYDLWSQIMEMHMGLRRRNSLSFVVFHNHLPRRIMDMRSGMHTIKRSRNGC